MAFVSVGITFTRILSKFLRHHGSKVALGGLTGAEIFDLVKSDAPDSDDESVNEMVSSIKRIMDEEETLWATNRNGDKIPMKYIVMSVDKGTCWVTDTYISKKMLRSSFRRGVDRGKRWAQREFEQRTRIYSGVN